MIEHVAVWTRDIDALADFYVRYFGGATGSRYVAQKDTGTLRTVFVSFGGGARLELMSIDNVTDGGGVYPAVGITHIAFAVGDHAAVDALAKRLSDDGHDVISAPRTTGDGYYEACVRDPDGNRVEIVAQSDGT
jgi:lactoylglutathione lyase